MTLPQVISNLRIVFGDLWRIPFPLGKDFRHDGMVLEETGKSLYDSKYKYFW